VDNHRLIIAPDRAPRRGWNEAFEAAHAGPKSEDELLLGSLPENEFDRDEWQW
jgi:hypothetical protein